MRQQRMGQAGNAVRLPVCCGDDEHHGRVLTAPTTSASRPGRSTPAFFVLPRGRPCRYLAGVPRPGGDQTGCFQAVTRKRGAGVSSPRPFCREGPKNRPFSASNSPRIPDYRLPCFLCCAGKTWREHPPWWAGSWSTRPSRAESALAVSFKVLPDLPAVFVQDLLSVIPVCHVPKLQRPARRSGVRASLPPPACRLTASSRLRSA